MLLSQVHWIHHCVRFAEHWNVGRRTIHQWLLCWNMFGPSPGQWAVCIESRPYR